MFVFFFFFSSRRRHTRWPRDWSSDVCSSDLCAALDRFTGAGKSKEDWIHISRDAEAIVINVPTGTQDHYPPAFGGAAARSEERRVGKECRSRGSRDHEKKKETRMERAGCRSK